VARTSGGKSQVAANQTIGSAKAGEKPLLLSLEDTPLTMATRFVAASSRVRLQLLRKGIDNLTSGAATTDVFRAMQAIGLLPIRISSERELDRLADVIEAHVEHDGTLVIVDYFGCILVSDEDGPGPGSSEFQRATHVIQKLESLAKELSVAIVLFVQSNRTGVFSSHPLELGHIRDSGFIENLSTAVLSIERAKPVVGRDPRFSLDIEPRYILPIRVLKNRWGPIHKPVDDGLSGQGYKQQLDGRIKNVEYDCLTVAWYPSIHFIHDISEESPFGPYSDQAGR